MAHNLEDESILDQAHAAIEEAKQADNPVTVSLEEDRFMEVLAALATARVFDQYDPTDEELLNGLSQRLQAGYESTHPPLEEEPSTTAKVTFDISTKEIDLVNKLLIVQIGSARRIGSPGNSDIVPNDLKGLSIKTVSGSMSGLMGLNTAFINAGGPPRPDFVHFRDGS